MQVFDHTQEFLLLDIGGLSPLNVRMNHAGMQSADIAWMLLSTALVLLMTPALAFF